MANEYKMNFFETWAKTNKNISEVFNNLIHEILAANEGKSQFQGEKLKKNDEKRENLGAASKYKDSIYFNQ